VRLWSDRGALKPLSSRTCPCSVAKLSLVIEEGEQD